MITIYLRHVFYFQHLISDNNSQVHSIFTWDYSRPRTRLPLGFSLGFSLAHNTVLTAKVRVPPGSVRPLEVILLAVLGH